MTSRTKIGAYKRRKKLVNKTKRYDVTYDIDLGTNIEAKNETEARKKALDLIDEQYNLELHNGEITKITKQANEYLVTLRIRGGMDAYGTSDADAREFAKNVFEEEHNLRLTDKELTITKVR